MNIATKIAQYIEFRKAYRQLSLLSDSALKDIGVSRSEVKRAVFGR